MNVTVVAASNEESERLCVAVRQAGFEANCGALGHPVPADTRALVLEGFRPEELAGALGPLLTGTPHRPVVLAGVADADPRSLDLGLAAGVDDFYPAGIVPPLVFRLSLWAHKGQAAEDASSSVRRIEQASDAIYTVDFEGRFTSANAAAERLTGYSRPQILKMNMSELLLPEYLASTQAQIAAKLAGEKDSSFFEVQIRHADGEPRWVEISSQLLFEDGKPVAVQGIARDLSARRELDREVTFRAEVLENIQAATFAVDTNGRVLFWNDAATNLFGIPADEAIGSTVLGRILQPDLVPLAHQGLKAEGGLGSLSRELPFFRTDGEEFPAHVAISPLRDSAGNQVGAVAVCMDLSERRAQEEQRLAGEQALRASEERYRAAAEISRDAFFILEPIRDDDGSIIDFRFMDMNAAAGRLLTIPRDVALSGTLCNLLPNVRPRGFLAAYARVATTGEPLDEEVELASPSIRARWIHQTVLKLGDGVAITIRDITERKLRQLELEEARALQKAIFESTSEAVLVIAPGLTVIDQNQAATAASLAIYGAAPKPGDPMRAWVLDSEWGSFQEHCHQAFAGERVVTVSTHQTMDGQATWHEMVFAPVRDDEGTIYAIAMTARDITESRRMERELAEREAALQAVFSSMNEALILVDVERRFILGNPPAVERTRRFIGVTPETGHSMEEYVAPEHWRGFRHYHRRALAGERPTFDLELVDPATGESSWWEYSYHPVRSSEDDDVAAVAMVIRDITDRKRAEAALAAATAHHRAVIENTSDALFALDVEGPLEAPVFRLAMVNSAFERLTGLRAERVIGRLVTDVLPATALHAALARYAQAIAARETITYEEVVPYGDAPQVQTSMTPVFDGDGRCVQIIGSSRDISERIRLEAQERASRERAERMALIVESASDAIISVDVDGTITSWSPGAERVYGYTAAEAIGQPMELMHVDDDAVRQSSRDGLQRIMAGGGFADLPRKRRHKDGRTLDVMLSAFPLRDAEGRVIGVGSTATDITEKLRAEEALRDKAADLDAVFSSSKDQIVLLDSAGAIISANPAARTAWQANRPGVPFEGPFRDWLPAETRKDFDERFAASLAGGQLNFERQSTMDGELAWFDVTYNPVRLEDGTIRGVVFTTRNVSEKKRSTEALMQAQKLESLAVLAGGIAHDFNNLLVGILGNAGIALAELAPTSPARPTIEAIEVAGQRAAELARQMLAYSGKGRFLIQDVDLSSVVQEMTHLLRVSIGKTVRLQLHLGADLPAVQGDATQLRQVVMNLVVNANDAIGDADGVIRVATSVIDATSGLLAGAYLAPDLPAGKYVSLEIEDSGSGMDPDTMARIFDPFFTTKFTGRGLGLAATLGIVRGHGGAIKVESQPGAGTTFRLLFPATGGVAPQSEPAVAPPPWRGEGLILVVDDEPTVRAVTARALKAFGFETLEAEDGLQGVTIFRERANDIVCVLLDMTMPRMNGEDAFVEIKRIRPDARVILMSGYAEQDATERFSGRGLAGFIQKPYELGTLRAMLKDALSGSAS